MALGGWRRLWVVLSVLWVAWMARQLVLTYPGETAAGTLVYGSAWAFGAPLVVYLIGLVAAWVVRGFRQPPGTAPVSHGP